MRKPVFSICENKGAYQLHDSRVADMRHCFRYIYSKIRSFKPLTIFCGSTAPLGRTWLETPKPGFSRDMARISLVLLPCDAHFYLVNKCNFQTAYKKKRLEIMKAH